MRHVAHKEDGRTNFWVKEDLLNWVLNGGIVHIEWRDSITFSGEIGNCQKKNKQK